MTCSDQQRAVPHWQGAALSSRFAGVGTTESLGAGHILVSWFSRRCRVHCCCYTTTKLVPELQRFHRLVSGSNVLSVDHRALVCHGCCARCMMDGIGRSTPLSWSPGSNVPTSDSVLTQSANVCVNMSSKAEKAAVSPVDIPVSQGDEEDA